jgi:putative FmdB family regulatory protein
MPVYEYYCRPCNSKFELLRPLSAVDAPADCPSGHTNATRTLSTFVALRGDRGGDAFQPAGMGGGCACGGACACGGH